ncbi:MAG TPA: energy-coupling factor transporter transmembrane component T [Methanomassiliicoccales archaeon]|nr:energy-coupling factor transporter transmembrane component T [Methanomassiliicoccales archaeon]
MPLIFPYQEKDSRLHRLDARPKIVFVLSIFLLSILISDIFYLAVLLAFVMCVVVAGKVVRSTLNLLKYTVYVAAFLLLFSVLFSSGSTVAFVIGPLTVWRESLLFAASMILRLFLAISAFSVLTFTIHPDQLLQAMSKYGFRTMTGLSVATRMYPTIAADSANIEDAMRARGVEFDQGNVVQKARAKAPVMMPLLLNSLDRSMDIAEAMEARGFGAGTRTHFFDPPLTLRHKLMMGCCLAAIPFGIVMFVLGHGSTDYLHGGMLSFGLVDAIVVAVEIALFAPVLAGGPR